jgi:hypothetical protein
VSASREGNGFGCQQYDEDGDKEVGTDECEVKERGIKENFKRCREMPYNLVCWRREKNWHH